MDEDIKIKVTIDDQLFREKPTPEDTAIIKNNIKNNNHVKEVSLKELLDYIGKGRTVFPAVLNGGTKKENWLEQQLFEIDIDNENEGDIVKPDDIIKLLKNNNLPPFGYYHSFSDSNEKPKFRILFRMVEPITTIEKAEFILKTLVNYIPQSDIRCTDVCRLYYGTNGKEKKVIMLDEKATITIDDVIKIYQNPEKEKKEVKDKEFWDKVKSYDWLEVVKSKHAVYSESSNRVDFITCPICGHKHCFSYYKNTNTFCCFGANGGISGTYVDYLVATENLSLKEAINKFKRDVLGETVQSELSVSSIEEAKKVNNMTIINQLNQIGLHTEYIRDIDWIGCGTNQSGEVFSYVICPLLAQFIRENVNYIFVRDNAKGAINRYFYLDNYYKLVSDDEIKGVIKACIPLYIQKVKHINEVLNLLYTDLNFVDIEYLNADENIINFNNGVLHLDTMELKPHSPSYYSTIRIPCNYYENVQSPETHYFDNFMNDLTEGNDEKKLLYYEAMGVAISNIPGYKMKKAFIQVGPGNTGKSKLKVMLFNLIGKQNCSAIDLQQLETPFGKSELFNKRLVGTNDLNFFQIATLDTFKQATGGDYINVQFKFENSFNMLFSGLLWFCGNRLPKFGGDKGEWVYDRFIIIKCDNVIPEEKRDADLVEHLLEEKDYIISLAIKGLKKVIDNGYKYDIPEECELAKSEFITDNDSFLSFYGECIIERDPDETIQDYCTRGKIFEVYRAWCRDNNKNHFNTKKEVKQILEKMGKAETIHAHGGQIYYKYITLNHDTNMEYSDICPRPPEDPKTSYFTAEDLGIETPDYNFK